MQCGLLGAKLSHSYSPQIHSHLGNYQYDLFEVDQCDLDDFFKAGAFHGINITIPYKKSVIPYCHALSDRARQLGAVNTIVRKSGGTLIGHNTDYYGFSSMLKKSGLSVDGKKVLVLGSGGASATVLAVLQEAGAKTVMISRSGENNYDNLSKHADASVIVNATPVGTYPNVDCAPLSLEQFPRLEGVLDLIYNPARTQLLMEAEKRGLATENGLWMLVAQAKESAEWFTGKQIDDRVIERIYNLLRRQMENTILIGMPGSGKSTIGQLLAEMLQKEFVDADAEIVSSANMSIPDIFAKYGEADFRARETAVLKELGKRSGLVIATGGGCVTRMENYPALHRNGTIIWLQRDIDRLPVDGRPLSLITSMEQMFANRKEKYAAFSDLSVYNNDTPEKTVSAIIRGLKLEA